MKTIYCLVENSTRRK